MSFPSLSVLPAPFEWIDIPAGTVRLLEGGYVPSGGQFFDVAAFAIAKYPLTNAQFSKFVEEKGYKERRWWSDTGWAAKEMYHWEKPRYWIDPHLDEWIHPVSSITWHEASAYCVWLSDVIAKPIRLPTEQEWQRSAQGGTSHLYPWGNTFEAGRCNFNALWTTPVTQFEGQGDSPFGVVDMSGNVWEWCSTKYSPEHKNALKRDLYVLRGGSCWGNLVNRLRTNFRYRDTPDIWFNLKGFRLACS